MYVKIKDINSETSLAMKDNRFYVIKKIGADEIELYKKLMTINQCNIANVIELIVFEEKLSAVLKYVDGVTIAEYVNSNGTFDDDKAKKVICDVCDGLSVLHKNAIIHRDINPNNVIITDEGRAVIIDFGICRFEKENQSRDTQILGTQGYAAPEQFGFHQTNERSDIYSVGVLLNFMKTGLLPGEKKCEGKLSEITKKCTEIDDEKRYKSVEELKKDIVSDAKVKVSDKSGKAILRTILHVLFYNFAAFFGYVAVTTEETLKSSILSGFAVLFMTAVPFWIFTDLFGWSKKTGLSTSSKLTQIASKFVLCLISFIVSIICIMFI